MMPGRHWAWIFVVGFVAFPAPGEHFSEAAGTDEPAAVAEPEAEPEQGSIRERVEAMLSPTPTPLPDESRVVRADEVTSDCGTPAGQAAAIESLKAQGVAVLDTRQPGLELRYFVQGIETMTRVDRLWERWPREAESMQGLIDESITRARQAGRPIQRLVLIGHAGLPGCAAFGGTLDDCVFKGRLTRYQRQQLARLIPYLAPASVIELRQCATGSGEEGQRLLTAIHELTGSTAVSYLADFHFGDSAAHPRIRVDQDGVRLLSPERP